MSFLEKKIKQASQAYYSGEDSGMSDEEFDKYMNKYVEENPDGELLKTGHGYDVTQDSTPGEKRPHIYGEAGSLPKAYAWRDFKEFIKQGHDTHMSLKIDGLSVVLYYVNSKLAIALTRGDGHIGIDITEKVLMIDDGLSQVMSKNFTGAVRGEIVMTTTRFEEFQKIHPEAKNPRNSAAGLINAKVVEDDLGHFLSIVVYTVIGAASGHIFELLRNGYDTIIHRRVIEMFLQKNFSNVAPSTYEWLEESSYNDRLSDVRNDWYTTIPADGIVISDVDVQGVPVKVKIHEDVEIFGYYLEYTAQAFKFQSETAESTVVDIEWVLSKHNRLKPTIVLEPVQLAGTTVQRATGYNAKYINDNRIAPYAVVEVEKHGEIIPNVNRVIQSVERDIYVPETCPVCGSDLIWDGVDLVCDNAKCSNVAKQDILIWLKNLVPTFGMGDKLIETFIAEYYGTDCDIEYLMSKDVSKTQARGAQEQLFLDMIDKLFSSRFKLKDALLALNIPRLGDVAAQKLSENWAVVDAALQWDETWSEDNLYTLFRNALGDADSCSICDNMNKFLRLSLIYSRVDVEDVTTSSVAQMRRVAVTGKLSVPRKQFEEELKQAGFAIKDISSDTVCLITDNPDSGSSKNKKADKLGIEKLTESQFRDKYMK